MIRKTEQQEIQGYLEDVSNFTDGKADEVVFPSNEKEVVDVLKEYNSKKKYLTPSGAGTGTTGARIPLEGGVIATDSFNKILKIDKKLKIAILQPGVSVKGLNDRLIPNELFYPSYPTEQLSFLGGNASTNASGEYSYRYGSVRNYVRRLRVALPSGKVLDLQRDMTTADKSGNIRFDDIKFQIPGYISPGIKNSAGYFSKPSMDIIDMFIGSEGTLGVITEIELSLIDKLNPHFSLMIFFSKENDLFNLLNEIKEQFLKHGKCINPLCLEFFDKNSLKLLKSDFDRIPSGSQCALLVENEQSDTCGKSLEIWQMLCEKHKAAEIWYSDQDTKDKISDIRHKLPERVNEAVKRNKMQKISLDIAVPEKHFGEMLDFYRKQIDEINVEHVLFGHIGENHLHLNLLPKNLSEKEKSTDMYIKCVKKAVSFGGTVSAEHGVGKLKHKYLEIMYGKKGIEEMKRVKKVFDPGSILSPGNLFPAF